MALFPIGFGRQLIATAALCFTGLTACLVLVYPGAARAQTGLSACDLNQDGTVNQADVSIAINMALGLVPCTANIAGAGVCNVIVVQRVTNAAAAGGTCLVNTSTSHTVALTWVASTSTDVTGYNIYRSSAASGPFTKLNSTLIAGTSFSDTAVTSGQTYYYVATTVDVNNLESGYSNVAQAVIPSP